MDQDQSQNVSNKTLLILVLLTVVLSTISTFAITFKSLTTGPGMAYESSDGGSAQGQISFGVNKPAPTPDPKTGSIQFGVEEVRTS